MQNNVVPLHPADYYSRLGSSLEEKLFFLDRIPSDVTVFADWGCADGRLLAAVAERRDVQYTIGFDLQASALPPGPYANQTFTDQLHLFAHAIYRQKRLGRKVCLVLSSVVHEILSQGTSWHSFWKIVREIGADYIAIRDMACELDATFRSPIVTNLEADDRMAASLLYNVREVGQFSTQAEMLEALLKYRYTENMQAELQESYFALAAEQWLNLCNVGSGYQVTHFDHHSVAWHRQNWKQDFGLDIEDPTHVKIILKRIP